MPTYNERIKQLRIQNDMTLKEVAAKLNITEATAQRYETGNGIKSIPYDKIVEYAVLFGVSPSYIMGWDGPDWYVQGSELSTIIDSTSKPQVLAAHFTAPEYTSEELEEIKQFAEFVKARRTGQGE